MTNRRDWLRLLMVNAIANLVWEGVVRDRSGLDLLVGSWPGFVMSTTISSMCVLVLWPLAPALYQRFGRSWLPWVIVVPSLILIAMVGTALAVTLLILLRHFDGWGAFVPAWQDTVKISIAMTLLFGIYGMIIEMLHSRLDQTTVALRTKERDEAEARRMVSDAQLASLESRVNPHFFFNTLNSIAALTREDAERAERMTTQLASLMRSSLGADATPLVPLEQEAQHVRDYLEIEQVRFGTRLRYDIRIPDDTSHALVPRLAVQTVVENSVKYAVSPQRHGASIAVMAHRTNGRLLVEVTDDGPGFDAASIPDGHGLALIRARLALLFDGGATLSVESRAGHTRVAMDLPASDVL